MVIAISGRYQFFSSFPVPQASPRKPRQHRPLSGGHLKEKNPRTMFYSARRCDPSARCMFVLSICDDDDSYPRSSQHLLLHLSGFSYIIAWKLLDVMDLLTQLCFNKTIGVLFYYSLKKSIKNISLRSKLYCNQK